MPIISWCGTYACLLHDVCSVRPLECKLPLQPVAGFIPLPESMVAQYWFHIERRFNYLGVARFLLPYPLESMITQYIQSRCSPSQSPFASRPSETIAPSYTFAFFVCFFPISSGLLVNPRFISIYDDTVAPILLCPLRPDDSPLLRYLLSFLKAQRRWSLIPWRLGWETLRSSHPPWPRRS